MIDAEPKATEHPLEVGEKTIIYTPDLSITHQHVRRTESGYEVSSTLTDWRPISVEKVLERI